MADVEIRPLCEVDAGRARSFFARVPEGDRTFFREDVLADGVVDAWMTDGHDRFVAVAGPGDVVGYGAVLPETGWSSHVGEIRIVVDPAHRREGVGRSLARHALVRALERDLCKLSVEVAAEQDTTVAMFRALGFEPEALLKDHIRSRDGSFHDLLVMSHFAEQLRETMSTTGVDAALA